MEEQSLLELVEKLLLLNDNDLSERVLNSHDVQWCLSELFDYVKSGSKPVIHGRWISLVKWWKSGSMWKACSVCKTLNYKSNFCPQCGAKMDLN